MANNRFHQIEFNGATAIAVPIEPFPLTTASWVGTPGCDPAQWRTTEWWVHFIGEDWKGKLSSAAFAWDPSSQKFKAARKQGYGKHMEQLEQAGSAWLPTDMDDIDAFVFDIAVHIVDHIGRNAEQEIAQIAEAESECDVCDMRSTMAELYGMDFYCDGNPCARYSEDLRMASVFKSTYSMPPGIARDLAISMAPAWEGTAEELTAAVEAALA
jgi:hypothetical protein